MREVLVEKEVPHKVLVEDHLHLKTQLEMPEQMEMALQAQQHHKVVVMVVMEKTQMVV